MTLCDLSEALTAAAFRNNGMFIEHQWMTIDVTSFEAGAAHAGPHSFDDQRSLEFSHNADDHDHGFAQRAGSIEGFPE